MKALIPYEAGEPKIGKAEGFADKPRKRQPSGRRRKEKNDFDPPAADLTDRQAAGEAGRCLQCDLRKDITRVKLWTEYARKGEP
jgi:hypothetical protein